MGYKDKTYKERVQHAVPFLDQLFEQGWRNKIIASRLDMSSLSDCVIGQITKDMEFPYCGFNKTIEELEKLGYDNCEYESFCGNISPLKDDQDYKEMDKAWKEELLTPSV